MRNKKSQNNWEYFNDCLICQAMEKADKVGKILGVKELETVFSKQNLKNKIKK